MKKRYIWVLKLISFTVMGAMGAFMNYINLYLEQEVGFTGSQIGIVTMISMSLVIVVNPILGYIGDKTGKHVLMLKGAFLLSSLTIAIYSQMTSFITVLLIAIMFEAARASIGPFFDLITSDYCEKVGYDFGRVRVFSSMGFVTTTMLVGFFIAGVHIPWFDGQMIGFYGFLSVRTAVFVTAVVMLFASFLLMFFVPKPENTKGKGAKGQFERDDIMALLLNKNFQFIVVFILLSMVALESAKSFVGNHLVVGLGSAENIVSVMTFVMVLPEFILLPLGSKIIRKVGFKNWYLLAMVTMILRMVIYSFTNNIAIFAIASAVHGFGVMTHVAGNIAFIRRVVEPKVLGLAFTIMASLFVFGRAILSFVYGLLYEHFDGFAVFRVATVLLVCGLIWVVRSKSLKVIGDEITRES